MNNNRRSSAKRTKTRRTWSRAQTVLSLFGKDLRSFIIGASTLATVLIIGSASIGLGIHPVGASGGQVIKLTTPGGGTTFYRGRCFRTDIKVQTDGLDANSVDIIIPYNPAYLAPYTGSGCTTSASGIVSDNLFPAYPSNTIVSNQVLVTGYDPDRKSTRLNSSHVSESRMPSSA